MTNKILFSVDVEDDLHSGNNKGISEGLIRFEKLCDKHNVKPVLFVVGKVLKENIEIFRRLQKKGWEISCHGYSHSRFDDMSFDEKEEEIEKCVKLWKKELGTIPRGFRAPQHSIDSDTLDLLEKYGFKYDSSYFPLNFLQLIFFPTRIGNWLRICFSSVGVRKVRENLIEIPTSAFFVPFVSFSLRFMPVFLIGIYVKIIKVIYEKPVFYAHSWDFIKLENSKVDRMCSSEKLLEKLKMIMEMEK